MFLFPLVPVLVADAPSVARWRAYELRGWGVPAGSASPTRRTNVSILPVYQPFLATRACQF